MSGLTEATNTTQGRRRSFCSWLAFGRRCLVHTRGSPDNAPLRQDTTITRHLAAPMQRLGVSRVGPLYRCTARIGRTVRWWWGVACGVSVGSTMTPRRWRRVSSAFGRRSPGRNARCGLWNRRAGTLHAWPPLLPYCYHIVELVLILRWQVGGRRKFRGAWLAATSKNLLGSEAELLHA